MTNSFLTFAKSICICIINKQENANNHWTEPVHCASAKFLIFAKFRGNFYSHQQCCAYEHTDISRFAYAWGSQRSWRRTGIPYTCLAILWSWEHLRCGRSKRWRKMTTGCLMCCALTKPISHFQSLSTPTTAEFGLLIFPELSCKLHCTTRKSRWGMDLPNLL